jgi:hypothetical protein
MRDHHPEKSPAARLENGKRPAAVALFGQMGCERANVSGTARRDDAVAFAPDGIKPCTLAFS